MMNGEGAQTFATGATYVGTFLNNLYSGEGESIEEHRIRRYKREARELGFGGSPAWPPR